MKRLSFLLLSIGMITAALDTNCMLLALRNAKRPLRLPQQKRFCSYQTPLEQRMNALEDAVKLQGKELAEIKAIVSRWNNEINTLPRIYDPLMDESLHGSFIDEHNMHYGNTSH